MDLVDDRSDVSVALWKEIEKLDKAYTVWYDDADADVHRTPANAVMRLFSHGPQEFNISVDGKKVEIIVYCSGNYADSEAPLKAHGYNKEYLMKLSTFLEQKGFTVKAFLEDDC